MSIGCCSQDWEAAGRQCDWHRHVATCAEYGKPDTDSGKGIIYPRQYYNQRIYLLLSNFMLIPKFLHALIDRDVASRECYRYSSLFKTHIRYSLPFHYQYYFFRAGRDLYFVKYLHIHV